MRPVPDWPMLVAVALLMLAACAWIVGGKREK